MNEIVIRIVVALIFAMLSTVFLTLSFFVLKKKFFIKNNLIVGGIFALLLFVFSFFSNILFTLSAVVICLLVIKYVYIRSWKETLSVWGIWLGLWFLLLTFIASMISLVKPFPFVL